MPCAILGPAGAIAGAFIVVPGPFELKIGGTGVVGLRIQLSRPQALLQLDTARTYVRLRGSGPHFPSDHT